MALQTSGAISLNQIHVEAGGTSGTQASLNDSDIRGLISKASGATMSFSEWYGASSYTSPSLHSTAIDSLSSYANGSGCLKIDDGVTSTLFTNKSYTALGSWSQNVNFATAAGRDIVITFLIKDRASTDSDVFYLQNRNTTDLAFSQANSSLIQISGTVAGQTTVEKANGNVYENSASYLVTSVNARLWHGIFGDAGDIYQATVKFTNLQSGHFSSSPDLIFGHEDDEDNSEYLRQFHINFTT